MTASGGRPGAFMCAARRWGRGEYHLTAFVWVFNRQRELLLTRRAPEKEHYANCWAATGGAALVGETSLQTVRRELREETGIEADEADFHLVRSFREHSTFSDVYFLFHDIPLSALHLQPGETTEARWVSKAGLEALVASGEVAQPVSAACASCGTNSEKFGMPETDGPQAFLPM